MGTSTPYGGPRGNNPLVPTWQDNLPPANSPPPTKPPEQDKNSPKIPPKTFETSPLDKTPLPPTQADRFRSPRNNFSRFAKSGGSDRSSLGRAVSGYVSTSSGNARTAARRMGASRRTAAGVIGFLTDVQKNGAQQALNALNLQSLSGKPIEEIFLKLADFVCPHPQSIDESIARSAFIETIADIAESGITNLDNLTTDQIQTVLELYATHAIEARLCNDIGTKAVSFPTDTNAAQRVQDQLFDFIRRAVADALTAARSELEALTPSKALVFVDSVYVSAFEILHTLGEEEIEE